VGFGSAIDPSDLALLFRSADGTGAAFVEELCRLTRDVEVLIAVAKHRYERLGYFNLVEDRVAASERDLDALHRAFLSLEARCARVELGPDRAPPQARALLDDHFRARIRLVEGVEDDLREVRAALALFTAHVHGRADLRPGAELNEIARRADLSAARLRARRADLEEIYQPAWATEPADPTMVRDLTLALAQGNFLQHPILRVACTRSRSRAEALSSGELVAFERAHARELQRSWRRSGKASRGYLEMAQFLNGSRTDGADLGLSKAECHRRCTNAGFEVVQNDPFLANAHFTLGLALEFKGKESAIPRYDRYLALRGIRHWDHRTFATRHLNPQQEYALLIVAGWRPPKRR